MTAIGFPWDSDPAPSEDPPPPPGVELSPKKRGRRPRPHREVAPAASAPGWLYCYLTVTGPAEGVDAFAAAARGAGVTPWRLDFGMLEEDIFNMAASQPPARRSLSIAGCRILARQFRERVERRQGRAAAMVGQGQGCPFDLHALLPVPDAILGLGPTHPRALAWLAAHWGVTDRLRQVSLLERPKPGRRLPTGFRAMGYGFFVGGSSLGGDDAGRQSPARAVATLAARWPALRLRLRQRPLD